MRHMHSEFVFEINDHMNHVKWLNFAFGPLSNGSKTCFWSRSNKWKWIRNGISDSLSITWWTLRIPTKIEIRSCDHLFRSKTRVDQQWITHMHTNVSRDYLIRILNWTKNGLRVQLISWFWLVPFSRRFDPSMFAEMNKRVLAISEQREF